MCRTSLLIHSSWKGYKASESTEGNLSQSANSSFYVWKLQDAHLFKKHFVILATLSMKGKNVNEALIQHQKLMPQDYQKFKKSAKALK